MSLQLGLFPSALVAAFLAPAWPVRGVSGARGLETAAALTWASGVALSAVGFLRLARTLRPGLSPLWAPAFVAGTCLWPDAAESFLEPWAGGLLALGAGSILAGNGYALPPRDRRRRPLGSRACLKPVLWPTATVLVLAAALAEKRQGGSRRGLSIGVIAGLAAGALLFVVVNVTRTGSPSGRRLRSAELPVRAERPARTVRLDGKPRPRTPLLRARRRPGPSSRPGGSLVRRP